MQEKTYYVIPQDLIRYKRVPIEGLEDLDNNPMMKNVPLSDEELLTLNNDTLEIKIKLTTLGETKRNLLQEHFSIKVIPFQLAFKVTIKAEDVHSRSVNEFESELRQYLIFSVILANKDMKIVYHENGHFDISEFSDMGNNGQGVFLPYSFIKLSEGGYINTYYQSDYDRTVKHSLRYFSLFEEAEITALKELLRKFIINNDRPIKDPTVEMFIHCHTFSWIPKGLFFSAVVTLASCFESLLGRKKRLKLSNRDPLLRRFFEFRNSITHLDTHDMQHTNGGYVATKYLNKKFLKQINLNLYFVDFSIHIFRNINNSTKKISLKIDDLEEVRKKLIEKIIEKL